jgi:DNA-binding CsgD family transcriptional regulator
MSEPGTDLVHVPCAYEDPERRESNTTSPSTPIAARRVVIAQRREKVADLIRAHVSYREIARVLGVGLGTVGDDVKAIKAEHMERATESYAARVAEEDAKLDFLERTIYRDVAARDKWACEFYLQIHTKRVALHGLAQPVKAEIKVERVEVEDRRDRARELLERASDDELARRREQTA